MTDRPETTQSIYQGTASGSPRSSSALESAKVKTAIKIDINVKEPLKSVSGVPCLV